MAGATAVGVGVALASTASAPTGEAPLEAITEESVEVGGGNNLVNVILTDLRALDTFGEIVVLAVVAVGILALTASARRLEGATS
jgi:multicomponent Na+:H+ antiporter subunit A